MTRDHPRVCGEHPTSPQTVNSLPGSSPRMRGAHFVNTSAACPCGIIPAYAGSTPPPHLRYSLAWDHPRVCGEHLILITTTTIGEGSSPRMRGALCFWCIILSRVGIIPAYAGSTLNRPTKRRYVRDHPRVCGEHESSGLLFRSTAGSSPRMRGAQHHLSRSRHRDGIIPAYAGSTCLCSSSYGRTWDHPRVCGEHLQHHDFDMLVKGSSPRMRGAH